MILNYNLKTSLYDNVKSSKQEDNNNSVNNGIVDNKMNVIAHRGYSSVAPENTIPAFVAAADNGYNTSECDIEWSKDNVPVILHDSTINRTSRNKNGWKYIFNRKCSSYTYEQLQEFDFGSWKGAEFKNTKIPSFDDLLSCANENDFNLYIEIKENGCFDEDKAQLLVEAVKKANMEDNVTWLSFEEDYLQMISDIMPDSRLGYLSDTKVTGSTIDILEGLDTDENEVFLDIKASKMNEKGSKMLSESGFEFEAWTVNKLEDLEKLYELGCKGITTDSLLQSEVNDFLNSIDN